MKGKKKDLVCKKKYIYIRSFFSGKRKRLYQEKSDLLFVKKKKKKRF